MKKAILAVLLTVVLVGTAYASTQGRLFPPEGVTGDNPCPSNQVLAWTGKSLVCKDPSPGVTTTACPSGQYMYQVIEGEAECNDLDSVVKNIIKGCRGPKLYLGVIQDVNAGVVTTNPDHLHGGTSFIGYAFKC